MNNLEKFMSNSLVIKINKLDQIHEVVKVFQARGFERIRDFYRVSKGDYSWMLNNYTLDELCIEYQMGKGFTISGKTDNLNYGNEVIDWPTFKDTLYVHNLIEKKYLKIFDEVDKMPEKIDVMIYVKGLNGTEGYLTGRPTIYGFRTTTWEPRVFKTKEALKKTLDMLYEAEEFDYYEFTIENAH